MSAIREALEAAQEAMSDAENFWGLDFDAALRKIDAALALEADTPIQSVAHPPRDGKQPGSVRTSSPEPVQAAPLPNPHVSTSQSCGNSAMSAVTRVPPPLSADPCLSAQMAMGIS